MKLSLRYISIKKYSAVLLLFLWMKGINTIEAATPKEQTTTREQVEQENKLHKRTNCTKKKLHKRTSCTKKACFVNVQAALHIRWSTYQ